MPLILLLFEMNFNEIMAWFPFRQPVAANHAGMEISPPPETDTDSMDAKATRQHTSQRRSSTYHETAENPRGMNSARAVPSGGPLKVVEESSSYQQPSRSVSKRQSRSATSKIAAEPIGKTSTIRAGPSEYLQERDPPTTRASQVLQRPERDTPISDHSHPLAQKPQAVAVTQQRNYPLRSRAPEDVNSRSADARGEAARIRTLENALERQQQETISVKRALAGTGEELQRTSEELEEIRKKWKKAVSQLSQLRSDGARSCQLIDGDLIEKIMQLRYEIQSFSVQYFAAQAREEADATASNQLSAYLRNTTPRTHDYSAHLESEIRGPMVIQSFLWRMLVGEVFGQFHWMPLLGREMTVLYDALNPGK